MGLCLVRSFFWSNCVILMTYKDYSIEGVKGQEKIGEEEVKKYLTKTVGEFVVA